MYKYERLDRRVEKTRNSIINAFKEMIIEKEFNEMTIKELAERANINRKTFYLHYDSMDDIIFDLNVDMVDQIFETLEEKNFFDNFNINTFVETLEQLINTDNGLYKKIFCAASYRFFSRNIKDIVKESFIRKIKNKVKISYELMDLTAEFVASGAAKVLKVWFEDNHKMSVQEISKVIGALLFGAIGGVIKYSNVAK